MNTNERALLAKQNAEAMGYLKHQYQPLIAARIVLHMGFYRPEYMEAGHQAVEEAVMSYQQEKGSFTSHLRGILKHRLIDLRRKERVDHVVPTGSLSEKQHMHIINAASIDAYQKQREAERRREEIEHFCAELEESGITLAEVAAASPKHEATKAACRRACRYLMDHPELLEKARNGRIPARELSEVLDVSLKTWERHRKYLIACAIAVAGDYHCITEYILDRGNEA